ncbi:bolA-like protein DDB_G0274169 [Lucilia sericata]|uniref:bolA-like protein DDB_G0274169 n=1 Tax=Lucilia sericata TaxID=13632 RepID=UPI0018A824FB|nr:bolA-like protein DDB_G0274169 [Lucilia sericata]
MINISRLLMKRPFVQLQNKMSTIGEHKGPVAEAISMAITENLQPVHLEVINESYMHNVPKGAETHFKVLIVSEKFEDLPLIKRHRLVNQVVKEKLDDLFPHALSIEAKTPKQWQPSYTVEPSPNCRGGFGK